MDSKHFKEILTMSVMILLYIRTHNLYYDQSTKIMYYSIYNIFLYTYIIHIY